MTASNTADSEVLNNDSSDFKESLPLTASIPGTAPTSSKLSYNTEQVKILTKRSQPEVECIDLDDDDDIVIEKVSKSNESLPPSTKRKRFYDKLSSPVPEDPKTNSAFVSNKEVSHLFKFITFKIFLAGY